MTTPLDEAHAGMEAAPKDTRARLRYFDRLAASELFLMLKEEAQGDSISPEVFDIEGGPVVLAFDTEERLAEFAGRIVPYAALSGRSLAGMLAANDMGLAVNPDVAPSAYLMPADAVAWLAQTVAARPDEVEALPEQVATPRDLPEGLVEALAGRLSAAGGYAKTAWLGEVQYRGGVRGLLLGFEGAEVWAHAALGRNVQEALAFSGLEGVALDVIFLEPGAALGAKLAEVGLRFDLPEPARAVEPSAPGMDPAKPPKLR